MATTTNYGWTTPNDTDLVKDGAAAIRTLGSSVDTTTKNLNPQTTTGALAYRSATANVNTALPIGTANQVLKVNSAANAPEWGTAAAGALTKIHSSTFSAVSSKSVTDCFSSTYENYKIIFTITAGSNSASIKLRLSSSGTDNTTSNYYNGNPVARTDYSGANNASSAAASFDVGRIEANSTQIQGMCFDFMQPELAKRTIYGQSGFGQDSTSGAGWAGGGGFDGTTQFQGITFFPTAGTFTGSIAIYGYEK